MEQKITHDMTCFLLGHNYIKITDVHDSQEKVICKNCGSEAQLDSKEEFDANPNENQTFIKALRRLFILKRGSATFL